MSNNGKSDDTRHGLILTVNLTNDGHVCESAFRESQLRQAGNLESRQHHSTDWDPRLNQKEKTV